MAGLDPEVLLNLKVGNLVETKGLFPTLTDNRFCWYVDNIEKGECATEFTFSGYYLNIYVARSKAVVRESQVTWENLDPEEKPTQIIV